MTPGPRDLTEIAAFGLALVAHDGIVAIVALGFAAMTPYVLWTTLF